MTYKYLTIFLEVVGLPIASWFGLAVSAIFGLLYYLLKLSHNRLLKDIDELSKDISEILAEGEKRLVVPFGNHSRGTKFLDYTHKANKQLCDTIDKLCRNINGFYFGRLDIKFNSWAELSEGKNFSIIELNGAGSEPAHIYDPKHNLFFAWKEIIRHWNIMFKIGRINYKTGTQYMTFAEGIQMLKENNKLIDQLTLQSNELTEN